MKNRLRRCKSRDTPRNASQLLLGVIQYCTYTLTTIIIRRIEEFVETRVRKSCVRVFDRSLCEMCSVLAPYTLL